MSTVPPSLDWSKRIPYDWTSPQGLDKLKHVVTPSLNYEPREFQLYDSACILSGRDVFCITATGDGKSALIYIPVLARKDMIVIVIEPTNFLESDLASNLTTRGLTSAVINADSLTQALRAGRDLWKEARDCQFQVLTFSPETLRTAAFDKLIQDRRFRSRWGVLVTDESHKVDEWGADFRTAYSDIWSLRSRGPEHLVFVALSASVEPGRQMTSILRSLGFRDGYYYLDKRDCERRNVDFIFRTIQYPSSGHEFRDLDWMIPEDMTKASDVEKQVLYCDTIEQGHRVACYLRSLLPPALKPVGHIIVRHMHSMNCPECKREGFAALYKCGSERQGAIFVATAVLEVGIDIPGLRRIVSYAGNQSASAWIQEGGRSAREPNTTGEAIFYIKKSDIDAALAYVKAEPLDERLLRERDTSGDAGGAGGGPALDTDVDNSNTEGREDCGEALDKNEDKGLMPIG
ncbi:P-loop containing nucleoside triphosphate hydrolase protein [Sparassis latifolia]